MVGSILDGGIFFACNVYIWFIVFIWLKYVSLLLLVFLCFLFARLVGKEPFLFLLSVYFCSLVVEFGLVEELV